MDHDVAEFLKAMNELEQPALYEMNVDEARAALSELSEAGAGPQIEVASVEDHAIFANDTQIPIRIYSPSIGKTDSYPIVLFFHGGGFALGDLNTHDNICRYFCKNADVVVVNVDYRRPPEHPFPASPLDCYAALTWTAENADRLGGDRSRIVVCGDSAGANLAAVTSLMARDKNTPPIAQQILIYPIVNLDQRYSTPSRRAFGGGDFFLSKEDCEWIVGMYLDGDEVAKNPYASPLLAAQHSDLPPALILTAGYDMLRDEGQAYGEALKMAGVEAQVECFEGTIHGFLSFNAALQSGQDGLARIVEQLQRV